MKSTSIATTCDSSPPPRSVEIRPLDPLVHDQEGASGTGKSSFIVAMERIRGSSSCDLKSLLIGITSESLTLVEDLT
ncbi:hypothetical protein QJS10_CPA06g00247 [Acorus calamus]|uniref:Uncharacterized protein n=1 Tax=Acorus calamus TaxID=4465 RepID=A0AAV9ELW3_ACOCL|nr:hypothetical protein QJS10_CPA06g00247 [Acorus calamus]